VIPCTLYKRLVLAVLLGLIAASAFASDRGERDGPRLGEATDSRTEPRRHARPEALATGLP